MSLTKVMEDLKEQIAEAEKNETENPPETDDDGNPVEEAEEEEAVEEPKEPEPKEEKKEEAEEPDSGAFARLRREAAASKKKAEELAEENARLKARPETQTESPAKPVAEQSVELPPVLTKIIEREQMNEAGREFNQLEDNFRQKTPDYDDISNAYKAGLYQSIRIQHPKLTHEQLLEETNRTLLVKAGTLMNEGYDPIEEMYHEAKNLGFKPLPKEEQQEEPAPKVNLAKLAANRSRNAGTAGAKGNGAQPNLTRKAASELTTAEWARLPKEEKKRLLGT
jgi:hypothetical protein